MNTTQNIGQANQTQAKIDAFWQSQYEAEAAEAMPKFRRAAKRVGRQIADIAAGCSLSDPAIGKAWKAVSRIEDRAYGGSFFNVPAARSEALATVQELRAGLRAAIEQGSQAYRAALSAEADRLRRIVWDSRTPAYY